MDQNIEAIYPLSPMQQGMLFHSLYAPPEAGMYVQQLVCTLQGSLEIQSFQRAWAQVVDRHPALRSFFVWEDRVEPLQVVCKRAHPPWELADWRDQTSAAQEESLRTWLAADRRQGLATDRPPLMRFALMRLDEERWRLVWSFHHLLLDGWCLSPLMSEVLAYYRAAGQELERPRPPPYRDYIAWLRNQDRSAARAFWQAKLAGFSTPTPVAVGGGSADSSQALQYGEQEIRLSATAALAQLARAYRLTLSILVQAAWGLLLARYSGEHEVVFGVTVSGRPPELAGVEAMIGVFINTLPVRLRLSPETPLIEVLRRLMSEQVERECYAHTPLAEIQAASGVARGRPLFETLVVFENYPIRWEGSEGPLRLIQVRGYERTNYPLTLLAMPGPPLWLRLAYDSERYTAPVIARMLGHLETLLLAMAGGLEQRVATVPLLSQTELDQLARWNATAADYPLQHGLHEWIEAQVARSPEAIAVVFEDERLSYRELDERANRLAHYLGSLGVGPEALVGVCLERSVELVVALLGILKSGAAYVPLDPGYPKDRLSFMATDSQVSLVLSERRLLAKLPADLTSLCLDADWGVIARQPDTAPSVSVEPDNLAYVIYTSGSTGRPKGAMNTHKGIVNRLLWMQETYRLDPSDAVLQKTPFSFDVSVWEFFWPLLCGARLVVARPEGHKDAGYLVDLIRRKAITTLHFVPPMLQLMLQTPGVETCVSLRRVICSGEALPYALQERFFAQLDAELHNLYGPTEAAIDVTAWQCRRDSELALVPLGRPIANTEAYILDRQLQPVPVGVAGELCLGGVQLARGYLNRPGLTAERFIPDPFSQRPGARLYRTGDLARWLEDGNIDYLGRIDHQVKVRGFRIEPGEIETVLAAHPGIREAVVTAGGQGAERQLSAHLVPEGEAPSASELRRYLLARLPEHMVPAVFVFLEALPLTANGKVDRQALPAPASERPHGDGDLPRTELERGIAEIWRAVLKLERVGIHDNFFELGGTSLLLVSVHHRLRNSLAPNLSLLELFRYTTIAALVERLSRPAIPAQERAGPRGARQAALGRQQQLRQRSRQGTPA